MNIHLNLTLPLKDTSDILSLSFDTLLKPFYISEKELLYVFFEEYNNSYFFMIREIIFLNSIKADEIIGNLEGIDEKELLILKKKLTLCLSIVSFGNRFNKDFITSLTRSKTFSDFSVSTTKKYDAKFVTNIIDDAQECIDKIRDLIGEDTLLTPALGYLFVKGARNCTNKTTSRLWHHGNLARLSKEIYAFDKKWFNGVLYKNGGREDNY